MPFTEEEMRKRFGTTKPFLTGTCAKGWHEGTRPKSFLGTPLKVCDLWEICTCPCHVPITEMYETAGVPRDIHQNPEYIPFKPTWVMPIFGIDYGMGSDASMGGGVNAPTGLKRGASGPPGARTFEPTPTGRAARGQLEDQVLECITEWLIDPGTELCTPSFVAWDIGRFHGIEEPSTGAVYAVFVRWESIGFAVLERKPNRLVSLTLEGKEKGLDYVKALHKRSKK